MRRIGLLLAVVLLLAGCGSSSDDTSGTEDEAPQLEDAQDDLEERNAGDPPPEGVKYPDLSGGEVTIYGDRVEVTHPAMELGLEVEGRSVFAEEIPLDILTVDEAYEEHGCDPSGKPAVLPTGAGGLQGVYNWYLDSAMLFRVTDSMNVDRFTHSAYARYALDRALEAGCDFAADEAKRIKKPGSGWPESPG